MPTYRLDTIGHFQRKTPKVGDFEDYAAPWFHTFSAWCQIKPLGSVERVEAQKLHGESTHQVILRQGGGEITPQMRVIAAGQTYDITGVTDIDGRGEYWELIVKRGQPDAR